MNIKYFFTYCIGLGVSIAATAQSDANLPRLMPISNNIYIAKNDINTFRKNAPTLRLPFFDDFSYSGVYPNDSLWLDRQAFVNNAMAGDAPPSVGVATLDGLDHTGTPYGTEAIRGNLDTLTSNRIDLTDVSVADSVLFSFFAQPKGLCYAPFGEDSLVVQFRLANGTWVTQGRYRGIDNLGERSYDFVPNFTYRYIPLRDERFFHNAFQFRFINYGLRHGAYNIWNLDYVRMDKNRRTNANFEDLAFARQPRSALKVYTAKPWRHVRQNLSDMRDSFSVLVRNHFDRPNNPTSGTVRMTETISNTTLFDATGIFNENIATNAIKNFGRTTSQLNANFLAVFQTAFPNRDSLVLRGSANFVNNAQATNPRYAGVQNNDIVNRITILGNEFAYDDGTAEMLITANLYNGNQIAMQFDANTNDTIRAVRLMFPRIKRDSRNVRFRLNIWRDTLGSNPVFTSPELTPLYPDDYLDTLQGFVTYRLENNDRRPVGVPIGAGKFFVGWEHIGNIELPIGFDRNNDEILNANKVFYWAEDGTWKKVPFIGAPMMRVVVGKWTPNNTRDVIASTPEPATQQNNFKIYPNPTSQFLQIENLKSENIDQLFSAEVIDLSGRVQQREVLRGGVTSLDVSGLMTGIYLLKIQNSVTKQIFYHKFAVQKF